MLPLSKVNKINNSMAREQFVLMVRFLFHAELGWGLLKRDGRSPLPSEHAVSFGGLGHTQLCVCWVL